MKHTAPTRDSQQAIFIIPAEIFVRRDVLRYRIFTQQFKNNIAKRGDPS